MMWETGTKDPQSHLIVQVGGAWKSKNKREIGNSSTAWITENLPIQEYNGRKIIATSPLQAEAYAILNAITDLKGKSQSFTIKSNCEELIKSIKDTSKCNKEIASIVREIILEANKLKYLGCIKVSRTVVQKAHDLAIRTRRK